MRSRVLAPILIASVLALVFPCSTEAAGGDRGRVGQFPRDTRSTTGGQPAHSAHAETTRPAASQASGDPNVAPFDWGLPFEWRGGYVGPSIGDYDGYPYSFLWHVGPGPAEATLGTPPAAPEPAAEPAAVRPDASAVDLQVSPPTALVFLNGVLIGSAEEFGGASDYLYLEPGAYTLEFRAPGFLAKTLRLKVSGEPIVVSLALEADPEAVGEQASPAPSPGLPYGRRFGPDFGSATGSTEAPAGLTGPAA